MNQRVWNGGSGDWTDPSRWSVTETGASGAPIPGDAARVTEGDVELVGAEGLDGSIYNGVALMLGDPGNDAVRLDLSSAVLGQLRLDRARRIGDDRRRRDFGDRLRGDRCRRGLDVDARRRDGRRRRHPHPRPRQQRCGQRRRRPTPHRDHQGRCRRHDGSGLHRRQRRHRDPRRSGGRHRRLPHRHGRVRRRRRLDPAPGRRLRGGGQTIAFGDTNGRLELADPGAFAGTITGFASGDLLDFTGVDAAAASYDAASETLTLADRSGAVLATLHDVQAASGPLTVTPNSGGTGTTVGYAGAPTREQLSISVADRAMRSDVVRATMTVPGTTTPITGAGVKVGIISGQLRRLRNGRRRCGGRLSSGQSGRHIGRHGADGRWSGRDRRRPRDGRGDPRGRSGRPAVLLCRGRVDDLLRGCRFRRCGRPAARSSSATRTLRACPSTTWRVASTKP